MHKGSIYDAALLIQQCRIFVANDCGIGHLAAAVNVPVVSIFGPTDPRKVIPWCTGTVAIRKSDCVPCFNAPYYLEPCRGAVTCLRDLAAEDVYAVVKSKIAQFSSPLTWLR